MDISKFTIGRPVRIKTEDDIYESYISAITLSDENFVYFKSGNLRNTLIAKLKSNEKTVGNKLDVTGGSILGNLNINGNTQIGGNTILETATINKNIEVDGALDVGGKTTLKDTIINGNEEVTGHIAIGKKYNTSQGGVLQVGGDEVIDGDLFFKKNSATGGQQIKWLVGETDAARVLGGATASNSGYLEMATADDGNEPIYVRQYTGDFATVKRTLTLLDGYGNTTFPGNTTISHNLTNTEAKYIAKRTDTNVEVWLGVGAGGTNHGVYSQKMGKWLVYGDGSNVYLNGNAATATDLSDTYSYAHSGVRTEAFDSDYLKTHTFVGSVNNSNLWRSLINVRHRGGSGDGNNYGLQIIDTNMTSASWELQTRKQYNGTWTGWEAIPRRVNLYNNTSGSTGTITLSQSAANFTYLKIYFKSNDNYYNECTVYGPNSKKAMLMNGYVDNAPTSILKMHICTISGTSITRGDYEELAINGLNIASHNNNGGNKCYITRVDGYN